MSAHTTTRFRAESLLLASAEAVWAEVQRVRTLHEVARPLLVFRPVWGTKLPDRWRTGVPVRLWLWAFGVVPLGPAVALHEGSTLVVVFNALRLLAYKDWSTR